MRTCKIGEGINKEHDKQLYRIQNYRYLVGQINFYLEMNDSDNSIVNFEKGIGREQALKKFEISNQCKNVSVFVYRVYCLGRICFAKISFK